MGKIASAKQTGQGGTSYEDKTNAFFLACMLTETIPFGINYGKIIKIRLQVRADGWLFDDCLLTLEKAGLQYNIGVSIKSAVHFTSQGCAHEINRLLWEQYLGVENKVFNTSNDYLCLVQSPLSTSVSESLNTVLQQATVQEAEEFFERNQVEGYNSVEKRRIFNSFACPADLAAVYSVNPKDIGKVLKRFLQAEFDFEKMISNTESRALDLCRIALKKKTQSNSIALFKRLCQVARDMASISGTIDPIRLVSILRDEYELNAFPSFQEDWKKIKNSTLEKLSVIRDDIGGVVKLSRTATIGLIDECFAKFQGCMLNGISGGGKTSVAKTFAEMKLTENSQVIWIDGADVQNDLLHIKLGLDHPIQELIKYSGEKPGYIIVDGIEKIYQSTIQKWMAIILAAASTENNTWKVLFTFPVDSVDYIQRMLHENNIQTSVFGKCQLQQLDDNDVSLLINKFPQIARFFLKNTMRTILSNLKLLDSVLADAINLSDISDREFGETQLIDFIWCNQIEKTNTGLQKGAFLKLLAEKQADKLTLNISTSEFSISDIAPGDDLIKSRFLLQKDEHFFFVHDLYGDWSRYKILLSKSTDIKTFLSSKHLSSPLWSRSIRLWGISLLEKNEDSSEWEKQFNLFNSGSTQDKTIQDLLLESFYFASNAYELMNQSKQLLFTDKGAMFKRLMKLFAVRATTSNPKILELASSLNISEASALDVDRIPIIYYWIDFLNFLYENADTVVDIDFIQLSSIASTWIKNVPPGLPLRKESSDLICLVAEKIFHKETNEGYVDSETSEQVYESMLMGYSENPDKIKRLALQIAKRLPYEKKSSVNLEASNLDISPKIDLNVHIGRGILEPLKRKAEQWPDGPYERVDEAFQKACLSTKAIYPILKNDPELASELLLAIIIDEPKDLYEHYNYYNQDYSVYSPIRWYPPFFLRGPFISFFRIQPIHAIRFMNRLMGFVTERYFESQETRNQEEEVIKTTLDGNIKNYKGDSSVFLWHKDIGNAPHLIVSLLMAFEQFLYENIEQKKDITEYVRMAVRETNSLAVVGVVLVVAKIQWTLYAEELFHLLFHPVFLMWDSHSRDYSICGGWGDLPMSWKEPAKKWEGRTHRFFPLKDALLNLYLIDDDFQEKFKAVTNAWQKEIDEIDTHNTYAVYIRQAITQLKKENWVLDKQNYFVFIEPKELTQELMGGRKDSMDILEDGVFAFKCRQIINGEQPITLETAEDYWKKIQHFIDKLNGTQISITNELGAWASPYTNILAAMATLICYREIWGATHPDYLSFIKNFCVSLVEKTKLSSERYEMNATMDDWTTFMAEIAPVIWKDDITNKDVRCLVAGCCILFSQPATERLLKSTANKFKWNDPAFIQLQNFLILFSSEYDTFHPYQESLRSLSLIRSLLIDRFINDEIASQPEEWSIVRQPEKWIAKETDHWRHREQSDLMRAPGLRTELLVPLFKNLPKLQTIIDTTEQEHICYLLEQAFLQVIYELGEINETSVTITKYPDDFTLTVLQRVASELVAISDGKRETFWKPLLSYGYIIKSSIDTFCKSFFLYNLGFPERHEKMVEILKEMVEFTYTASTWTNVHISRHEDFRLAVVGMQQDFVSIWTDDYISFMDKANAIYTTWFVKRKLNPFAVLSLLDFIMAKSGEFIIPTGLIIINAFFKFGVTIAQGPPPKHMVYVGHPDHDAKLALALSYLWNNKKKIVLSSQDIFDNYKDLVQYLISINNPVGIDLQDKLVID